MCVCVSVRVSLAHTIDDSDEIKSFPLALLRNREKSPFDFWPLARVGVWGRSQVAPEVAQVAQVARVAQESELNAS